jgi:hypothetical protein
MSVKPKKILVTLPEDVYAKIKSRAEKTRRSLSGYVGYTMSRDTARDGRFVDFLHDEVLKKLAYLESQVYPDREGRPYILFPDRDGLVYPQPVDLQGVNHLAHITHKDGRPLAEYDFKGHPTLRDIARCLVLRDYAKAFAARLPESPVRNSLLGLPDRTE